MNYFWQANDLILMLAADYEIANEALRESLIFYR